MKKILSLLLAVITLLSIFTVTSFAADEKDLPIFPEQVEGHIHFAAENVAIPQGAGTYDVPIYLVSDYTPNIELSEDAIVELGFNAYLVSHENYANINSITIADEVMNLSNYQTLDCTNITVIPDDDIFHLNANSAYFAFASGLEVLKQQKLKVATVNITVNENFPGGDELIFLRLIAYDLSLIPVGYYPNEVAITGAIFDAPLTPEALENGEFLVPTVSFTEGNYVYNPTTGMSDLVGECFYEQSALYEKPKGLTWQDKLLLWARKSLYAIFARLDALGAQISEGFRIIEALLDNLVAGLPGGDEKPVVNSFDIQS